MSTNSSVNKKNNSKFGTFVEGFRRNSTLITLFIALFAVSGLTIPQLYDELGSALFPSADFTIESLDNPKPFMLVKPILVDERYNIETKFDMSDTSQNLETPMKITISFENQGKKKLTNSSLTLYFVDMLSQLRGEWIHNVSNEEVENGIKTEFIFPPNDQKVSGTWVITSMLYDSNLTTPVSYFVKAIYVTESPENNDIAVSFGISILVVSVTFFSLRLIRERKHKKLKELINEDISR